MSEMNGAEAETIRDAAATPAPVVAAGPSTPNEIDAVKAGAWTALWTFLGMFGLTVLGWLQGAASWASTNGHTPLPGLSVIGYGFVSAVVAAVAGFVSLAVRLVQVKTGKGAPPSFSK